MRVLFVTPHVPSPRRGRSFPFIRALAGLGHRVTLVALGTDGPGADAEAREALTPYCEAAHVVPLSRRAAALRAVLRLARPAPLLAAPCPSPEMESLLRGLVAGEAFDVAHVEHLRAAHFALALKGRLPLVLDSVECATDLQKREMEAGGWGTGARLLAWAEHARLRRHEPKMAALFDRILMASQADADGLQSLAGARGPVPPVDVLPDGVDLDHFRPRPDAPVRPGSVVFPVGTGHGADGAAGRGAALSFCAEVFPLIRKQHPPATLTIAGGDPAAGLRALAARPDSGIEVTGRVPDLRPFLARASAAVCPLRQGVGLQDRVLEAMAMGKAMVATPAAARALHADAPGECLCVADTPLAFATQLLHLLQNPAEAARLGGNARRYAETWHDWHTLACRLLALYQDAIATFEGRPPPAPQPTSAL